MEIDELKNKQNLMQIDIDAMLASAYARAEQAEKKHSVTSIAMSNSLHRSAKEESEEFKEIEQEIIAKLQAAQSNTR